MRTLTLFDQFRTCKTFARGSSNPTVNLPDVGHQAPAFALPDDPGRTQPAGDLRDAYPVPYRHQDTANDGAWGAQTVYGTTVTVVIRSTSVVKAQGQIELARRHVRATGHAARRCATLA